MKIPYFPNVNAILAKKESEHIFPLLLKIHEEVRQETPLGVFLKEAYERCLAWDKFSHMPLPDSAYSHEALWLYLKMFLRASGKPVKYMTDIDDRPFTFCLTDHILKNLHFIDMHLSDNFVLEHADLHQDKKQEWLEKRVIASLIDEAITSSQIEGAATTRTQAKAMIKSGKKPVTDDEKMILNNYRAIRLITQEFKESALSAELIQKIHSVLTDDLMDDPHEAGRFRQDESEDEKVRIWDDDGLLFTPPHHSEIKQRIDNLCRFVNDEEDFYHPVIKAVILHFMIGYIHPFTDGNGRTARGLFYWYLVRKGYRLFEYVSISEEITKSIGQYKRAYLYTEKDDADLTYFIYYHLEVIRRCIGKLEEYIARKMTEYQALKKRIRQQDSINLRQIDLLNHALRHTDAVFTIKGHLNSNKISWATARSDLLGLEDKGFLTRQKSGKELYFLVSDQMPNLLMRE